MLMVAKTISKNACGLKQADLNKIIFYFCFK
jgi:hypothetical protein